MLSGSRFRQQKLLGLADAARCSLRPLQALTVVAWVRRQCRLLSDIKRRKGLWRQAIDRLLETISLGISGHLISFSFFFKFTQKPCISNCRHKEVVPSLHNHLVYNVWLCMTKKTLCLCPFPAADSFQHLAGCRWWSRSCIVSSCCHWSMVPSWRKAKLGRCFRRRTPSAFCTRCLGAAGCWVQLKALRFGSRNKLKDDQRCRVRSFCSVWLYLVKIGVRDYARFLGTHWDVLGLSYNTFHDRPVLNNVCQVRFILHVEHERSCIDSMVENWAMMQRRLPCQFLGYLRFPVTSCMTPWYQYDTNTIPIWYQYATPWSAAMAKVWPDHTWQSCGSWVMNCFAKAPRHAELQGDEWLFPPEWARGKGGLHVVPWYQPNARPITSKIFKVIHNPWESMRIHENSWISRSIQRRLPAKPSPIHLNRVRRSKVSLWRRYAKNI